MQSVATMAFAVVTVERNYNSCRGFWLVDVILSVAPEQVGSSVPNGMVVLSSCSARDGFSVRFGGPLGKRIRQLRVEWLG